MNAFKIVKDFEDAVAEYTGAPFCVAVNSCTNALFLSLMWEKARGDQLYLFENFTGAIEIPKHTYVSVPMQIKLAGGWPTFRDEKWSGIYQLKPLPIWDAARRFTSNMYKKIFDDNYQGELFTQIFVCTSHHWNKILGVQQGGCILHNSADADKWFRKARFDGRTEGVNPLEDNTDTIGWHCYMSPEIAAEGLVRLMHLPKHNFDMANDAYPDLSQMSIFQ